MKKIQDFRDLIVWQKALFIVLLDDLFKKSDIDIALVSDDFSGDRFEDWLKIIQKPSVMP